MSSLCYFCQGNSFVMLVILMDAIDEAEHHFCGKCVQGGRVAARRYHTADVKFIKCKMFSKYIRTRSLKNAVWSISKNSSHLVTGISFIDGVPLESLCHSYLCNFCVILVILITCHFAFVFCHIMFIVNFLSLSSLFCVICHQYCHCLELLLCQTFVVMSF